MLRTFDLVIPAYNEEEIIKKSILKIYRFLDLKYPNVNWQLTLANNGSSDRTGEISCQLINNLPKLRIIDVPTRGKGNAVYESWITSDKKIVAFIDADLSIDVTSIPDLLEIISNDYPAAIASRFHKKSRVTRDWIRTTTSFCYNKLANLIIKTPFTDHQCGFKAMKRDLFLKLEPLLTERGWFFDTELLYALKQNRIAVKEAPIVWKESLRQSRVLSLKNNALEGIRTIFKIKKYDRVKFIR